MAAIAITACTVSIKQIGGLKFVKIVTPNTADDGDTIDVSTIFAIGCFAICSGSTDNTGLSTGAEWGDLSIVLPGSTDNEIRTIIAIGE